MKVLFLMVFTIVDLLIIAGIFTVLFIGAWFILVKRITKQPIQVTVCHIVEDKWEKEHFKGDVEIVTDDGRKLKAKKDEQGRYEYVDPVTGRWVVCE